MNKSLIKEIVLKKIVPSDWQFIYRLETIAGKSGLYESFSKIEELKNYMKQSLVFIICFQNKPVGFCSHTLPQKGESEITGLVILPKYRGRKIAQNAMAKMINNSKRVKKFILVSHPKNVPAIKLYLNLGFVIDGFNKNFRGWGPRVIMVKDN